LGLKAHCFNFYCSSQTLALRKGPAYDPLHVLQISEERITTSEPQSPDAPDVTDNNLIHEQIEMINSLVSELQGVAVIAKGEDVFAELQKMVSGSTTPDDVTALILRRD